MKILFIGAYFPRPNNSQMGTWALDQMQALSAAGHAVTVVSPLPAIPALISKLLRRGSSSNCPPTHMWDSIPASYPRWPVYPVGPLRPLIKRWPGFFLSFGWRSLASILAKIHKDFCPDVIFAHHGEFAGYLAYQLHKLYGTPYYVMEHSNGELEMCDVFSHRKRHYRTVTSHASAWLAVSERMKSQMRTINSALPLHVVYNGAKFKRSDNQNHRPVELADKIIVLCASFFYKRKCIPALVAAFALASKGHPDAILLIAGDGEDRTAIEDAISVSEASNIKMLGAVSSDDVARYMEWADIFALVGKNEPFGVVFAEALMAGCAVVAPDDSGFAETIANDAVALLVPPNDVGRAADALGKLIGDSALRKTIATAGKRFAMTELSWDRNAAQLAEIFSERNLAT